MKIRAPEGLVELYDAEIMGDYGPVTFSKKGIANVKKEIGLAMVEKYEDIVEATADDEEEEVVMEAVEEATMDEDEGGE